MLRSPVGWAVLLWLGLALAGQMARSLKTPIEVAAKADPVGLLRADRHASLTAGIAVAAISAAATWLWAGNVLAIADGTGYALALVVALLLGGTGGAWTCYVDARLRLAALRRLPWRTLSFLDDAHRRGVLRQTGAVYQFRHIRLQQQLAARIFAAASSGPRGHVDPRATGPAAALLPPVGRGSGKWGTRRGRRRDGVHGDPRGK